MNKTRRLNVTILIIDTYGEVNVFLVIIIAVSNISISMKITVYILMTKKS